MTRFFSNTTQICRHISFARHRQHRGCNRYIGGGSIGQCVTRKYWGALAAGGGGMAAEMVTIDGIGAGVGAGSGVGAAKLRSFVHLSWSCAEKNEQGLRNEQSTHLAHRYSVSLTMFMAKKCFGDSEIRAR